YERWLVVAVAFVATLAAFVAATVFAATAFTATLAAAFIAAALVAAFAATVFTAAALAAFVAALAAAFVAAAFTAATALVTYEMAGSIFEDEARGTMGNRDFLAVTALEFVSGRTRGRRCGNTNATNHFVAPRAMWRWNHTTVTTLEHVAGWALRTVLVEAGAAARLRSDAACPRKRAAGAEHEKSDGENCGQALPHEKSLVL
ncbi:MAG: hypothetical protein WAN93_11430, partial [Solirubrobacteraceae bacterium]